MRHQGFAKRGKPVFYPGRNLRIGLTMYQTIALQVLEFCREHLLGDVGHFVIDLAEAKGAALVQVI